MKCELFLDTRGKLSEGPVWDDRNQCLYWVDILGQMIHRWDALSGQHHTWPTPDMIGCLALCENGKMLCALRDGIYRFDPETGAFSFWVNPEGGKAGNRFNDGKVDPAGRLWAGTLHLEETSPEGALFCLEPNGSFSCKRKHVTVSNGMAWSPDQQWMYYIDSPTRTIFRYAYTKKTGEIRDEIPFIQLSEKDGYPDGMTIDQEGNLYVAEWLGWKISIWSPSGKKTGEIPFPVSNVSCPVFGGPNGDILYVTTARKGLSETELEKQPHAGSLFQIQTTQKGLPVCRFRG